MSKMMVKEWIFDGTEDKKKLAARLITAATVLLLIFAGSPFANINTNTASAVINPYAPVGTIVVNTNNTAATFTLTGPATYTGSGIGWSQADAPEGTYTITFDPIPGYDTPSGNTQTLISGGTITFTGLYNLSVGTITVTTNNNAATFNITGPATYTGSGTSWSQSNAPIGTYTITYDPLSGYDTPPSDTQILASKGTIDFTGVYNLSVGTITVTTNNSAATFTLTGPATYTGSGTGWSQADAPAGTYTITYDPIPGYDTPASEIQNLVSGDSIAFTGLYDKTVYTLTLQASDLTLQASTDTYVSQFKQENNINYGTDIIMKVRSFLPGNSGNVKNERSFIMFDIPPLPSGSTIVSATLQLYTANVSNATRNYTLMPVEQQWNETNVTWNNQPSVISSATSYADTPLSPGWVNWSVTSGVMAWANGATNYGWQISDMNENSPIDYSTAFYTRDYSDTSLRPTLVIQYTIV
jgi:hypothetical protein